VSGVQFPPPLPNTNFIFNKKYITGRLYHQ